MKTNSNYLSYFTDENNITTAYNYDSNNGLLLSKTYADNSTIGYSYNAIGELTSVSQIVNEIQMGNSYSYENDRISTISHNGFLYDYDYDM